jgi:enoyl-CoA hydratase/carnithine racemase/3-hydroxyacyl-CoA dehydrogenase
VEKALRPSTLETLGLGSVLDIFKRGALPVATADLVEQVFGAGENRGCLVISGANGIVGAGKTMQLASRLAPYGVTIAALDFPGAPSGLSKQFPGLTRNFGKEEAAQIMGNIVQFTYDGKYLPKQLAALKPRFLLEAVPEILEIKKAHYELFRQAFPGIEIRSVTSGFPRKELGVGIAHPSYPHEISKIYEIVEPKPSAVTQLLWSLGLIPIMVSDDWSFVLDVLFTGVFVASSRYNEALNMPEWKIDKYVRQLLGPNPFRAHDFIGAKGSNFLTWSCLDHLAKQYGGLFTPTKSLVDRMDSGLEWYPPKHFRPIVNWPLDDAERAEFETWLLGPMFQMTSLLLHEKRSHLSQMNAIGELCAQFKQGMIAVARSHGAAEVIKKVETYHKLYPGAANSPWYPETFEHMDTAEWQQLYVNAEHDGEIGVITISRESYNQDVNAELNRAVDWLKAEGIGRVILTGDFHLSTQLIGADTSEFFPALEDRSKGVALSQKFSQTARRLYEEFQTSVGFVNGKRCLGGMLELMEHCHYVVAVESTDLGMPEVTLPVVPGMEGCHWIFRKSAPDAWKKVLSFLLEGRPVKAKNAVGWLVDYAGPLDDCIKTCWLIAKGDNAVTRRTVNEKRLTGIPADLSDLSPAAGASMQAGRKAILDTILASCGVPLSEAIGVQATHSGEFMTSASCRSGTVGAAYAKAADV